jgi:acyl carrier protein
MELFKEVAIIINRNLSLKKDIKPRDLLHEDLHIGSFDTLMIGCDLEDQFHVSIEPEEIKSLKVVQDLVDMLEMKVAGYETVNA